MYVLQKAREDYFERQRKKRDEKKKRKLQIKVCHYYYMNIHVSFYAFCSLSKLREQHIRTTKRVFVHDGKSIEIVERIDMLNFHHLFKDELFRAVHSISVCCFSNLPFLLLFSPNSPIAQLQEQSRQEALSKVKKVKHEKKQALKPKKPSKVRFALPDDHSD